MPRMQKEAFVCNPNIFLKFFIPVDLYEVLSFNSHSFCRMALYVEKSLVKRKKERQIGKKEGETLDHPGI